jgi:hypothetical protein
MKGKTEMSNPATLSGGPADRSMTPGIRAARIMGWASFGLAAAFLTFPRRIAGTFGLQGKENLIRAFGGQEVLAGVGALSVDAPSAMWGRAAGDVVHIATVATGLRGGTERQRRNAAWGVAALVGFLAVDVLIAARASGERRRSRGEQRDYGDRSGFPNGLGRARTGQAEARSDVTASGQLATAVG